MSGITRALVLMVGMIGLTACLKPNPLAEIELASDETVTGSSDDPLPDSLDPSCEAPPELRPECGGCLSQSCCTSLEPCGDDPICVCEAACVFAGNSQSACRGECGGRKPDPEPLAPLLSCAEQLCPDCFVE